MKILHKSNAVSKTVQVFRLGVLDRKAGAVGWAISVIRCKLSGVTSGAISEVSEWLIRD